MADMTEAELCELAAVQDELVMRSAAMMSSGFAEVVVTGTKRATSRPCLVMVIISPRST